MNAPAVASLYVQRRLLASATASLLLATGLLPAPARAQGTPAALPSASPSPSVGTVAPAKGDLVSTAKSAGNFTVLLKALDAAGLTATLQKPGPYTLFAPTDAAFAKLPAGTLDNLLKPENKTQLVALLSYHVADGKFTAADLAKLDEVKTLEGTELDIEASADGKSLEVDEGKIVPGGVEASNGIIHAIDTVLQP